MWERDKCIDLRITIQGMHFGVGHVAVEEEHFALPLSLLTKEVCKLTMESLTVHQTVLCNTKNSKTKQMINLELHENAFTNIGYGILKTCDLLAHYPKGKAKQHIILISDGDATAPHPSPERFALRQASAATRRGITISCVCIAQESSNPELMRRIAKIGKGRIYLVGAEELTTTILEETTTLHAF